MTGDDLCFLWGSDAARLIAARKLSPVELVDVLLARIDAVPVGLQVVGPWHSENRLLWLAAELELARPWSHRRPALVA